MHNGKRIKVLQIITRLDRGGSAKVVLELAAHLDRRVFAAEIISGLTIHPQERIDDYMKRTGIKVRFLPALQRELSWHNEVLATISLYRLIREIKPDLVHTHSSKAGILGRLATKLNGISAIVHSPHGHVFYGYFGRAKTGLFIFLERLSAFWTDNIFTLTEVGKADHIALRIAPQKKFISVPCGIDLQRFQRTMDLDSRSQLALQRQKKDELGFAEKSPIIGTIARLVPIKGQSDFLVAAAKTVHEFPNAAFVIVGEGELKASLMAQAKKLGIDQQTYFLGQRSDIAEILATFDLFVLPSHNEGLGRVLLEAMAMGKPIVATTVGGIPEIVKNQETGILVPPHAPDRLAEAISYLLKNPTLGATFGQRGKERVKIFDIQKMVEKIELLYHQVLSKKTRR